MERRWSLHAVKMNGSNRSYINELLAKKQMRQIGCNQVQTRKGGKTAREQDDGCGKGEFGSPARKTSVENGLEKPAGWLRHYCG